MEEAMEILGEEEAPTKPTRPDVSCELCGACPVKDHMGQFNVYSTVGEKGVQHGHLVLFLRDPKAPLGSESTGTVSIL